MSARAIPYHNGWTESIIGTIKTEMLHGGSFIDHSETYIDAYYNTR